MGNKFLLVILLAFVTASALPVFAVDQFQMIKTKFGGPGNTETPVKGVNCEIPFSKLNYVGLKFTGPAYCIDAKNDGEARKVCLPGFRVVNPGNRQYSIDAKGSLTTNPAGYYYCAPLVKENDKEHACRNIAPAISDYRFEDPFVKFKWVPKTVTDGDCLCSTKGQKAPAFECDQITSIASVKSPCEEKGLADVSLDEYNSLPPELSCDACERACKCSDGKAYAMSEAVKKCSDPSEPAKPTAQEAPKPPAADPAKPDEAKPDDALKACMESWKNQALACKSDADSAKKECDGTKEEQDAKKENMDAAKALDVANKVFVDSNKNANAQEQCFTSSLVTREAQNLLTGVSDSCKSGIEKCSTTCKQEDLDKIEQACRDKIGQNQANQDYFNSKEEEIKGIQKTALEICGKDAKEGGSKLSNLLDSIGKALQKSLTCMCQLSSSGAGANGDCKSIPTQNDCFRNPTDPRCGTYGALDACVPGATFNAHLCNCQTNPKAAGCPGYASGGLSNFASGTQIRNNSGSSNDPSLIAGGLKPSGGDFNLSGGGDDGSGSDLKYEGPVGTGGAGGPGGGPGSGFGGAGGSGGNGGANGPVAGTAPEEKGILDGMLNKAKTFMSNLKPSSKNKANGNVKGAKDSGDSSNPNAYRPMRGIASRTGLGTKNQDIFVMMNKCFIAETCRNNNNSFLDSALKLK